MCKVKTQPKTSVKLREKREKAEEWVIGIDQRNETRQPVHIGKFKSFVHGVERM